MGKPRSHLLDIYGTRLHLATTPGQWRRLCRQYEQLDPDMAQGNGCSSLFGEDGVVHLAFYVSRRLATGKRIEVAGHEAAHGAGLLFEDIEAKYDALSEPFAWLVGWLTRWLWEATTP